MCMMAILYKIAGNTPILIASNRDEFFNRPTQAPKIQSGSPRAVFGTDLKAGGTWFGVNQHGVFVTVTNRPKTMVPAEPRSRGLLCRELLKTSNTQEAAERAAKELATGAYAGANYVCADAESAVVVYGGDRIEVVEIKPGLHLLSNGDLDDPNDPRHEFVRRMLTLHTLDSAVTFLAVASRVFSRKPEVVGQRGAIITGKDYGTISSTLLALANKIQQSTYQYAPGPPCDRSYDDLSALLRQVLSTGKSKKNKNDGNGKNNAKGKKKEALKKK